MTARGHPVPLAEHELERSLPCASRAAASRLLAPNAAAAI
jgi:hypothetical protein